jgi:non-haem dioxygenase in morphine synthesis N-terminal
MQEVRREVSEPPLVHSYQALLQNNDLHSSLKNQNIFVQEIDLPLIDLCNLQSENRQKKLLCAKEIVNAATEWGFFQVLNHGISLELLEKIKREQVKLFRLPFEKKVSSGILNDSYRWGNPTATSVSQFSWSEAFHVPLEKILDEDCSYGEFSSLRYEFCYHE